MVEVLQAELEAGAAALEEEAGAAAEELAGAASEEAGAADEAGAAEDVAPPGLRVMGIPTEAQMPSRTVMTLAWSAAEQALWTHGVTLAASLVEASQEQVKSVALQPTAVTPLTMQVREHDGRSAML